MKLALMSQSLQLKKQKNGMQFHFKGKGHHVVLEEQKGCGTNLHYPQH
jgi:hypothetical protein